MRFAAELAVVGIQPDQQRTFTTGERAMSADEKGNEPGTQSTSDLESGDAGTKGTGSAGRQAGYAPDAAGESGDAGTKGTGSAGRQAGYAPAATGEGGDAGTKGTGSAG
jgi:hypothetical protein